MNWDNPHHFLQSLMTSRQGPTIAELPSSSRIKTIQEIAAVMPCLNSSCRASLTVLPSPERLMGIDNSSQVTESADGAVIIENDYIDQACDISMLERIIRTHPVWFLPSITRPGAIHLLQGKEIGNFVVRKSSKQNTMAISVRLPKNKGPYIEHYLIEATGREYHLEGSDNHFEAIPTLVAHYCECCDELPVQLTLPQTISLASSRQELSSIAMLGQDFWVSTMAKSPSTYLPELSSKEPSSQDTQNCPPAPAIPSFSTFGQQHNNSAAKPAIISLDANKIYDSNSSLFQTSTSSNNSTLEHKPASLSPPPPPPRWCKPQTCFTTAANFTVTTTVTFNMNQCKTNVPANTIPMDKKTEIVPIDNEPLKRPQTLTGSRKSNSGKHKKKMNHYTQSNIIDSPPDYYRSSLADKISDYEDIWASPSKPDTPQPMDSKYEFVTFKAQESPTTKEKNNAKGLASANQTDQEKVKLKEQVNGNSDVVIDESDEKSNGFVLVDNSPKKVRNKLGLTILTGKYGSSELRKQSSPFYTEPVDSVNDEASVQRPKPTIEGIKTKIKHRNKIHPRLLNHRHSDPNIQWPLPKNSGALETIFASEDTQTLSSSLNNLSHQNNGVTDAKGGFVNAGFHSQSSQSLLVDKNGSLVKQISDSSSRLDVEDESNEKRPLSQKLPLILPKLMSGRSFNNSAWPVDSSWEWLGIDGDSLLGDSDVDDDATIESLIRKDAKFPLGEFRRETSLDTTSMYCSDRITVEDLIQQKSPDLHVPEIQPLTRNNLLRVSEYDNLDDGRPVEKDNFAFDRSETASSMTEFSEPWDSAPWDQLMRYVNEAGVIPEEREKERHENCRNTNIEENEKPKHLHVPQVNEKSNTMNGSSSMSLMVDDGMSLSSLPTVDMERESSCAAQDKNQLNPPSMNVFLLRGKNKNLGDSIREYVLRLSQDKSTTFGNTIDHFIRCTLEGHEMNPHVVMRNVRQFMSGIKNYLVKSGEGQFETVVQSERSKLKANEFLNLDAILESVLNKIVIKPLKKHIYQLFVNEYTRSGALKLLSDNIKYARTKTPGEFGIEPGFNLLKGLAMDSVHHYLRRLQQVYSPMKKLENLLAAISHIIKCIKSEKRKGISLSTDDFLPVLMYVLVHCGMIAAEIEADYMWGLLHPSLLTGEGGYYLTTLSSAVHVLKTFHKCNNDYHEGIFNSFETRETLLPMLSDMQGFMKILIPDELNGSIISKTFPIRPRMSTREIVKMIAHKFSITNPQDYGLFKLVNGEETLLMESECPYSIKAELTASGMDCAFAYKRVDAKIAWPLSSKS